MGRLTIFPYDLPPFVKALQPLLNDVLDIVYDFPLYLTLNIDKEFGRKLFLHTYQHEHECFQNLCNPDSMEAPVFAGLLMAFKLAFEEIVSFRAYLQVLLDFYYERLNRRNSDYYAVGLYDFLSDISLQQSIAKSLPPHPGFGFSQSRKAMVEYTTIRISDMCRG